MRRYLTGIFVLLVLLDLGYSGYQHYVMPIDGDLTAIIAPAPWYSQVLADPLGLSVLLKNETYSSPNRYFAHATMAVYFRYAPLLLQGFVAPVDSIYLACDLFKILLHLGLLYLLACYASGQQGISSFTFWLSAVLVAPLFQTYGFGDQMAVIDSSITYCFFYALPLALLLVWLWPFYAAARRSEAVRLSGGHTLGLLVLAAYLALHGPIVAGVVAILFPGVLLVWVMKQVLSATRQPWTQLLRGLARQVPRPALLLGIWFGSLVLYSLYIGRNNSENLATPLPLTERYELLLLGIADLFKGKPGLWLLLAALLVNAVLLRWWVPATRDRYWLLTSLRWLGVFALLYIAVTPLGGFRPYRPHILRYDLIMPLTLAMMAAYAASSSYLLRQLRGGLRSGYIAGVVGLAGIYWLVDISDAMRDRYLCERRTLKELARATEPLVKLPPDCTVMAWGPINDAYYSDAGARMLFHWGVTDTIRHYYQPLAGQ